MEIFKALGAFFGFLLLVTGAFLQWRERKRVAKEKHDAMVAEEKRKADEVADKLRDEARKQSTVDVEDRVDEEIRKRTAPRRPGI